MVGRIGEDEFGTRLRGGLEADGVVVDSLSLDPEASTGVAVILLEESGQNRIIVIGGANANMGDAEITAAAGLLSEADVVLMQLETPLWVIKEVAEQAKARGVKSILDVAPADPNAAELIGLVDVTSPNEVETEALVGFPVRSSEDARKAARSLREGGAGEVVLKLGERGAYWLGEQGEGHFPAFQVDPVDSTAAGDAFTACLAVGIGQGLPMPDTLRRANGAGALACLKLGAQPSMPTAEELRDFLSERTT
jgi:ribokinase